MESYGGITGKSGIKTYEVGQDFIIVSFINGSMYLYNYSQTGSIHVNTMIKLAKNGNGLNSYINLNTKYSYTRKLA